MNTLRIGDVARLTGRHPNTIRRYEARGLIPKPKRDPVARWRLWSREEVETIRRLLAGNRKEE